MPQSPSRFPRIRTALATALLTAIALLVGLAQAVPTQALTTIDIYMSTTGSDSNPGTQAQPVKTLVRASELVFNANTDEATIHIDPGTYYETETIEWDGAPQEKVNFRRTGTSGARPVFDGSNVPVTDSGRHCWMRTGEYSAGPSLDVRGMKVLNYGSCALRFYHVDDNLVRNMIFEDIGNRHIPGTSGWAAIHVTDSNDNAFINNIYRNLENDSCPGCVHAIYPSQSSNNVISDSLFEYITGDPIRLRDGASNNDIYDNTFRYGSASMAEDRAMVSYWRFSGDTCGVGNTVDNNVHNGRYYGGQTGQQIIGNGAEDGLTKCSNAISGSGNQLVDD